MNDERARLVEVAALDALDRSERLEPRVESLDALAQSAYGTAAKAEQDAEEVRRAVAARWILDSLGDSSVWLGASIMEVAAARRNAAYRYAQDNYIVRLKDWLSDLAERGDIINWGADDDLGLGCPYVRDVRSYRVVPGFPFKSRASWEASREAAAREYGAEAERNFIASVVQVVAEDVTGRLGFDFWSDNYVSVEIGEDGDYYWKAHPR